MESILVLVFLSWIVSAIISSNKKKKRQQQRTQQQPNREQQPQEAVSPWHAAQMGFGYNALNPFAEVFPPVEDESAGDGQTAMEPESDIAFTEGECYDEQHQHGASMEETKWTTMNELEASSFSNLDLKPAQASLDIANKPGAPIVPAQPQNSKAAFAFGADRSEVVRGIIWSEVLARPQERMARRHARRF